MIQISDKYSISPALFYPHITGQQRMNSELQSLYVYERNLPYSVFVYPRKAPHSITGILPGVFFDSVEKSIEHCANMDACEGFSYFGNNPTRVEYIKAPMDMIRGSFVEHHYVTVVIDRSKIEKTVLGKTKSEL